MSRTHDPVRFWARAQPERIAIESARHRWTYAALEAAVAATAEALLARDLGAGEHVALEFPPEEATPFLVTYFAAQRLGLLPVVIGGGATASERETMRAKAQTDYVLTAESVASAAEGEVAGPLVPEAEPPDRRLDAPAAVVFTSGTSGAPRAVVLTHGNFLWSAIASARNLGVVPGERWLCPLPLHHIGGLSIATRCAAYGTTALLRPRADADEMNRTIDEEGVTLVSLVPTMLARLLRARGGRPFPSRLRAALVGGAAADHALLEEAAVAGLRALPTYGLTEATSQVATLSPDEWPAGLCTAGRPLSFMRVEIRDDEGRALPAGREGEITIRGPAVSPGTLGDGDAAEPPSRGRWLATGDIGLWDDEGRLVVLDRRLDRIVTGGENVSPLEVERVLATHPAVLDVCVVGLPSTEWGQEVAAVVVTRDGPPVTLESLRAHAGTTLSSFKLPRHAMTVSTLPRSAGGKLLRRVARDRFLDEVAKQKHP